MTLDRLPLKEVVIGPLNDKSVQAVKTQLAMFGYNLDEIEVRKSSLTGIVVERG